MDIETLNQINQINWNTKVPVLNTADFVSLKTIIKNCKEDNAYKDNLYIDINDFISYREDKISGGFIVVNTKKEVWYHTKYNVFGDWLVLVATTHGLLAFEQLYGETKLRNNTINDKMFEALKIAADTYGFMLDDDDIDALERRTKISKEHNINRSISETFGELDIEVLTHEEMRNMQIKEAEYVVQDLVLHKASTYMTGKSGAFKSMTCFHLALCIAAGIPFMGRQTKKLRVMYLNEENAWNTFKPLAEKITNGTLRPHKEFHTGEIDEHGFPVVTSLPNLCIETMQGVKLDNPTSFRKLKKIVIDKKIDVLIIDSFRRFVTFEENDANKVNAFYCDYMGPLINKLGIALIMLQHAKKDPVAGANTREQMMDMLRGSSDLVNIVDCNNFMKRHSVPVMIDGKKVHKVDFYQIKMRGAEEAEKFTIDIVNGDEFEEKKDGKIKIKNTAIYFDSRTNAGNKSEEFEKNERVANNIKKLIKENDTKEFKCTTDEILSIIRDACKSSNRDSAYTIFKNLIEDIVIISAGKMGRANAYTYNSDHQFFANMNDYVDYSETEKKTEAKKQKNAQKTLTEVAPELEKEFENENQQEVQNE